MASPTSRTLDWLRKQGLEADVVERWIPRAFIRKDLFGIIDIVSAGQGLPIAGWQATATGCLSARVKKAMAEPRLIEWLKSGGRFYCIGWALRGKAGKKKVWTPKVIRFQWFYPDPKGTTQFEAYMDVREVSDHSDLCMCIDCMPTQKDEEDDQVCGI